MDDQSMQTGAIIFAIGLPILIFLQWKLGLLTGREARHQSRNLFTLIVGVFFVAAFGFMFRPNPIELSFSMVLGLVVALPAWRWLYTYYGRRIRGHKLIVARRSDVKQALIVAGTVFGLMLFSRTPPGREFMEAHWLVLGLAIAWPLATAYAYFYIFRLEHTLGQPIEESPPE